MKYNLPPHALRSQNETLEETVMATLVIEPGAMPLRDGCVHGLSSEA